MQHLLTLMAALLDVEPMQVDISEALESDAPSLKKNDRRTNESTTLLKQNSVFKSKTRSKSSRAQSFKLYPPIESIPFIALPPAIAPAVAAPMPTPLPCVKPPSAGISKPSLRHQTALHLSAALTKEMVDASMLTLRRIVDQMLHTIGFEIDELAVWVLLAERVRDHAPAVCSHLGLTQTAYACALLSHKFCNDTCRDLTDFAFELGICKHLLRSSEAVIFQHLMASDALVVSTIDTERAVIRYRFAPPSFKNLLTDHECAAY